METTNKTIANKEGRVSLAKSLSRKNVNVFCLISWLLKGNKSADPGFNTNVNMVL